MTLREKAAELGSEIGYPLGRLDEEISGEDAEVLEWAAGASGEA